MCEQIKFFSRLHQYYFSSFPHGLESSLNLNFSVRWQSGSRLTEMTLRCPGLLVELFQRKAKL